MRSQPCVLALSLLLLAPNAARGQTQTSELNLGRVVAIDRSISASPTAENLFIVPQSYTFKVGYKLQDTKRSEPFNTRATAELLIQDVFGRLGRAEDWSVVWRDSKERTDWNPYHTYKLEGSFSGAGTLSLSTLLQRFVVRLKAESGRSSDTESQGFTLVRQPSRGDLLFLHALIENEAAKAGYGLFLEHVREYADGTSSQELLAAAANRLMHNARMFIEYYDIYSDPGGNWADIVVVALELIPGFHAVSEVWMLAEYTTMAMDLINDVNSGVSSAINMAAYESGMEAAYNYMRSGYCTVDPLEVTADARAALRAYGYNRTLDAAATATRLESAVAGLEAYRECVAGADSVFVQDVESMADFNATLSQRDEVVRLGHQLFDHHERYVAMHQLSLAAVAVAVRPRPVEPAVCGDGRCTVGESCTSCPPDCCRPGDLCFALPAGGQPSRSFTVDYNDDHALKRVHIDLDDLRGWLSPAVRDIEFAWTLKLVGRAYASADRGRPGIRVAVNGVEVCEFHPHERFPADRFVEEAVCSMPIIRIRNLQLQVAGPFREGWNTILLTTDSHWDYNGLRIGLDPARDCDRSAWDNNRRRNIDPARVTGELMIFQEIKPH
ncbi:MAG: hypothetical protein JSW46_06865 [Gemmatimonadota bacterium]|nr:MAG: hypothetical protein JSW46_06865 [Gemmatimonadota bacterium]